MIVVAVQACRDIAPGTELLVWYGDTYVQFMGIPVGVKDAAEGGSGQGDPPAEGRFRGMTLSEGTWVGNCG